MNLSKKLKEWQSAHLIDGETAERIYQHEQQSAKPIMLWAFGGLGAFTIIVGLISVIAANWVQTPDSIKLAVDLFLCLVIAIALYSVTLKQSVDSEKLWLKELLVILYFGFTLASMALIGQTYQLGGSAAKLFFVWTLVTIPLVLLGRGKFLAALWFVGTATTYVLGVIEWHKSLSNMFGSNTVADVLVASLLMLGPLIFICLSRLSWLLQQRALMAGVISKLSWLSLVAMAWFSQFLWYQSRTFESVNESGAIVVICAVAVTAMVLQMGRLYPQDDADTLQAKQVVLVAVFLLGATALWHEQSYDVLGALTNILYMGVLAWAALKIKSTGLFNMITAVICLRVLIVYFEIFGSMLETGIGLIIGGLLTLLIAWWWFKKSSALAQRLAGVEGASS